MIPNEVDQYLRGKKLDTELLRYMNAASAACREGVKRVHIISYVRDGALLQELFTRDGSGTLITHDPYEEIREAEIEDIGGMLELMRPLEEEGILVRRSRERLETEINHFVVIERDGMIVGCAALYPLPPDEKTRPRARLPASPFMPTTATATVAASCWNTWKSAPRAKACASCSC